NVGMHRVADLVGPYGGTMGASSIGPTPEVLGYQSPGAVSGWAYGSDTGANPIETPYVKQGPYPGAGAFWPTFELSSVKNAAESEYGGDLTIKYGGQARRFMLFQTDISQPHLNWDAGSVANNSQVKVGEQVTFKWVVYGGLTADNTLVQYGTDPDPVKNPQQSTKDNLQFNRKYQGGTVWDNAKDGVMAPHIWTETVTLTQPGDYYFTAKAMLDQVYHTIAGEAEYGANKTYLRLLKERLKEGWTETINGEDGAETMTGRTWWYSPVVKITASGNVSGPVITQTAPGNGALNVPTSTKVDVTWSKGMDKASAEAAFTIAPAAAGTWAWSAGDTVQTLTPGAVLANDTQYSVNVATTAKDAGGVNMGSPYAFNFRTIKGGGNQSDTTPPTIILTDPKDLATGVPRDQSVSITFSEPMDRSISENATGVTPGRNLVYSWNGNVMTFEPDLKWDAGCEVLVDVNTPARDLAGNQLQTKYNFKFTAEGDCVNKIPPKVYFTVPENLAKEVDVKTQIKVGFTRDMKALTLDTAFVVNPVLKFNVVASGFTATLEHADAMKPNTKYTVTVSKEATSTEGLTLGTPHTFTFTTTSGGPPPPPPPPNGTGGTGSSVLGGMLPFVIVIVVMAVAVAAVAMLFAGKRKRDRQAQQAYQQQWQWQQQGPPGGWG
ncbi:MAG TPA: Ig-like domain-containing protein, partial [Thermoplasmata archaeon]|nr:Ig-like domain-containing protein [Thermoplasmata archaeon]